MVSPPHSPKPPYNAPKFVTDVEYLAAESEEAVRATPPENTWKKVLIWTVVSVIGAAIGWLVVETLAKYLKEYFK